MVASLRFRTGWGYEFAPGRSPGAVCGSGLLVGVDLGDGGAGGLFVDDAFAVGEGGDECLDREVVDGAGDPA